jgi:hypothetical protein
MPTKKRIDCIIATNNQGIIWQLQLLPPIIRDKQVMEKVLKLLSPVRQYVLDQVEDVV